MTFSVGPCVRIRVALAVSVAPLALLATPVSAQHTTSESSPTGPAAAAAPLSTPQEVTASSETTPPAGDPEIVVTATKQAGGVRVRDVPIAVTAFGGEDLAKLQFRSMSSLNNTIPNSQVGVGSSLPGTANFAMRGLGTQSGVASVEPTVGLFVDGIYMGTYYGAILDTFDLEGVEVLRGPQGVLFGKNVTGGAVVVRTTTPKNELFVDAQASVESGPQYTTSAVVSGPLVNDVLSVKVAGYYTNDEGYFHDEAQNEPLGGGSNWIGRAAFKFTPSGALEIIGRYEHNESDYDTDPPQQSDLLYAGTFKFETSGLGYFKTNIDQAILETNLDVGFGHGVITNIFGYRDVYADGSFDIDASRKFQFQGYQTVAQNQLSNELRYSGKFGSLDVLAGLYYFGQDLKQRERRELGVGNGGVAFNAHVLGGGHLDQTTYGAFGAVDWHILDSVTLNLGARYTQERKSVSVATLRGIGCNAGDIRDGLICNFDFTGKDKATGLSPRIGFQWKPNRDTQVYASWSKGFRAGGFNFRNTTLGLPPGPFRDEINYSLEAGFKTLIADVLNLNIAIYHAKLHNLQRDRIVDDPALGKGTLTGNVGNATFQGIEAEALARVTDSFSISGFVGTIDAHYDSLDADLSGDGTINQTDLNLKIVRAPALSYGIGASFEDDLVGIGHTIARVNYGFTDRQAYLDNNTSFLRSQHQLDASVAVQPFGDRITLSAFGRNLLGDEIDTAAVSLPAAFGGDGLTRGYRTLNKGRVLGVSIRYRL